MVTVNKSFDTQTFIQHKDVAIKERDFMNNLSLYRIKLLNTKLLRTYTITVIGLKTLVK